MVPFSLCMLASPLPRLPTGPSGATAHSLSLISVSSALSGLIGAHGSCSARAAALGGGGGGCTIEGPSAPGLVVFVGCAASREEVAAPLGRCFSHIVEVG